MVAVKRLISLLPYVIIAIITVAFILVLVVKQLYDGLSQLFQSSR